MIKKIISTLLCLSIMISLVSVANAADTELVNVALNKPIEYTTGVIGEPENLKENLVDGSCENIASVLWDGANTGVGFLIDLGKIYSIEEFKIHAAPFNNPSGRDQVWVDYSADNSSYTNIYARNMDITDGFSSTVLTDDVLTINAFGTVEARYIKVYSWTYTCWSEFEVFATLPLPKYVDTTYNQRVITTEFTENIDASTVTDDSFKVYANNVLLTNEVDYTRAVSGKNVVITLLRDYYDTEFRIEATTAIGTGEYNLAEPVTDTVTAPPAVEITGFEILPPDGSGNVIINASIQNNTSTETTSAVVFAFLLDENNIVIGRDMWSDDSINAAGDNETPQLTISTSGISGNCKVKAFVWKDLSDMQVWANAQKINLN